MSENIKYCKATADDIETVTNLLYLLYDGEGLGLSREELIEENKQNFADSSQALFLAFDFDKPVGISHGSLRREYVNGANDGLKGYLEAIYVLPEYRMKGIAAELVKTIERWAGLHGCREMASDCLLDNTESYKFHLRIGFEETERNVFFLKQIEPLTYEIRRVDDDLKESVQTIIEETWHSMFIATDSKLWDTRSMSGFAAVSGDDILGYLLYEYHSRVCEIMVLESIAQNIGIATALIKTVIQEARSSGVKKVIVTTSNDNAHAIRFYQKRGFRLRKVRIGAMNIARKLKPQIPLTGEDGIPLRDEIEFEINT